VAALDANEAVFAGRTVGKKGKVDGGWCGRGGGRAMVHHERLQKIVVPLGEGHAREEPSRKGSAGQRTQRLKNLGSH
jgi:hypothetical protein